MTEHKMHASCFTTSLTRWVVVLLMPISGAIARADELSPDRKTVTVRFTETDELVANPGKGWMTSQRLPGRTPRLPCSVAYFRLKWGDIEPVEGKPKWELIDESIDAWQKQDVRIAFRIMTANAHTSGYYCSPKWLFDAGCRSYEYTRGGPDTMAGGKRILRIEPDYGDPMFLKKHGAVIKALADRYDGHPRIEFLDIGSYGIWGEWHTPNGKPWAVRRQIVDMYLEGFRKTPVLQMSDDAEALAYSIARGAGFRRDGVGSPWHEKTWIGSPKYADVAGFADCWKRAPVVFEWFGPYDFLKRRDWSFDSAVQFILANHATYINDNLGQVPEEAWPKLHELARRSGYRFVLREISHAASISPGDRLAIRMKWSNVGVGKLHRKHQLVLYLLNSEGKIASSQAQAGVDATNWLPGDHDATGQIEIPPSLPDGTYSLGIALVDPHTQKPAIQLAIGAAHDGRMHRVTRVTVR